MITTHNIKGVCVHSHTKTQTNPGPSGGCKQLQRSSILQLQNIVILSNRFIPYHPVYESALIVTTKNSDSHIQARGKKGKKIQEEDNSVFAKFHLRTLCSAPNTKFLHSFCRHNTWKVFIENVVGRPYLGRYHEGLLHKVDYFQCKLRFQPAGPWNVQLSLTQSWISHWVMIMTQTMQFGLHPTQQTNTSAHNHHTDLEMDYESCIGHLKGMVLGAKRFVVVVWRN